MVLVAPGVVAPAAGAARRRDPGWRDADTTLRIHLSTVYTARTPAGRALYALHGLPLEARPGTPLPAATHVAWHRREVFKGEPLAVPA